MPRVGGWLTVLLGTALVAVNPAPGVAKTADHAAMRIMPLGDSITAGWDAMKVATVGGYRGDLYQRLVADGRAVSFVGDRGTPGAPDRLAGQGRHQGEGGKRIDEITEILRCSACAPDDVPPLEYWQPDTILLHAGTNDLQQGATPTLARDRLLTLLSVIWQRVPGARVYLASIIPSQRIVERDVARGDGRNYRAEFNELIRQLVPQQRAAGRPIEYVHMGPSLSFAMLGGAYVDYAGDGIHPSNGGYSKMAVRWHAAIAGHRSIVRWEAEALGNVVNRADLIFNDRASDWGRVGHIDYPDSFVRFNVTVPAAGAYRMFVRAGNGNNMPCTHNVRVNGVVVAGLTYASYDDGDPVLDASGRQLNDADADHAGNWGQWNVVALDIDLASGANAIRFDKGSCTADIDAIDLMTM